MSRFERLQKEFPNYKVESLPAIPASWQDTSWHNDQCPSFMHMTADGREIYIYVDFENTEEREFPESQRFTITGADDPLYHGDDWQAVLAAVAKLEG